MCNALSTDGSECTEYVTACVALSYNIHTKYNSTLLPCFSQSCLTADSKLFLLLSDFDWAIK